MTTITRQMAEAINAYAGREIIGDELIGKEVSVINNKEIPGGYADDWPNPGDIVFSVEEHDLYGRACYLKKLILDYTGQFKLQTIFCHGTNGEERDEHNSYYDAHSKPEEVRMHEEEIYSEVPLATPDPLPMDKTIVISAALAGPNSLPFELTGKEKLDAGILRMMMGDK